MIELNFTLGILIVNFLLLMFILNRKLFKPMLEHLEKRDEAIKGSLKSAQEMEDKGGKKLAEHKTKLQEEKRNVIVQQNLLRDETIERQKEVLKKAKLSSEMKFSEVKSEINQQVEALRKDFSKLAGALASGILAGIIAKRHKFD